MTDTLTIKNAQDFSPTCSICGSLLGCTIEISKANVVISMTIAPCAECIADGYSKGIEQFSGRS